MQTGNRALGIPARSVLKNKDNLSSLQVWKNKRLSKKKTFPQWKGLS